jgi:hypothetical protein
MARLEDSLRRARHGGGVLVIADDDQTRVAPTVVGDYKAV